MKKKLLIALITITVVTVTALTSLFILGRKTNVNTNKNIQGLNEELSEIMYLGSLAPSSHNIQCWQIELYPEEGKLTVSADPERKLDVVDPHAREQFLSLGCYIRTLEEAFLAYGYNVTYSYDESSYTMNFNYKKISDKTDSNTIARIKKRHTDKRSFDINDSSKNDYVSKLCKVTGSEYYSFDTKEFAIIKKATSDAYIKQAYDPETAKELSEWLRLSDKETKDKKDGLSAEQLGITGIKKVFYYLFTNHETAKGKTFADQGIANTENQLSGCMGFIIVSSGDSKKELVECGIKTTDIWLDLTENNISVHPMSYAIEESEYKATLKAQLAGSDTNNEDVSKQEPQMLLRVGCVKNYGENNAIRRDLQDYIKVY